MHPVTRIYWTAWLFQIQTTHKLKENYLCIVLTHGWQSARVCALYAHMPCTAQTVCQWKKLARSRVLNTRPLLATSLNPFYNSSYQTLYLFVPANNRTFSERFLNVLKGFLNVLKKRFLNVFLWKVLDV